MNAAPVVPYDLVASDYDLTLATYPGGIVGTRTLDRLRQVRSMGVELAVISGRSTAGLTNHLRRHDLDMDGLYVVGYNGAQLTQGWDGKIIASFPIGADTVAAVMGALAGADVQAIVPHEGYVFTTDRYGELPRHEAKDNQTTIEEIPDWGAMNFSPHKVLMGGEREALKRAVSHLRNVLGDRVEVAFSAPMLAEVNAKGVSKGLALNTLSEHLGIESERTLSFGDNENDIPLLQQAGFGVAMENAIDAVKEHADKVTGPVHEDGVGVALEQIFALSTEPTNR